MYVKATLQFKTLGFVPAEQPNRQNLHESGYQADSTTQRLQTLDRKLHLMPAKGLRMKNDAVAVWKLENTVHHRKVLEMLAECIPFAAIW